MSIHQDYKIKAIAQVCHSINKAFCESIGDFSQKHWNDVPEEIKQSAIDGVHHVVKNIETITPESSHQNWSDFKYKEGWVYGPTKDMEKKTHPCLVPYSHLPKEQRSKDYIFIQTVKSLWGLSE